MMVEISFEFETNPNAENRNPVNRTGGKGLEMLRDSEKNGSWTLTHLLFNPTEIPNNADVNDSTDYSRLTSIHQSRPLVLSIYPFVKTYVVLRARRQ